MLISGIYERIPTFALQESEEGPLGAPFFMISIRDSLEECVRKQLELPEFQHCFFIDLVYQEGSGKIEVYLDADSGIDMLTCSRFSRSLESQLDTQSWTPSNYTLEVSSPGLSRPLYLPRQYAKHCGHPCVVHTKAGMILQGKLVACEPDSITLQPPLPAGKRSVKFMPPPMKILFQDIIKTFVQPGV